MKHLISRRRPRLTELPAPLTPADLDLRDFDWMPLQVARLRDSNIVVVASGEAFRAAVLLWCAAWHQVPAASLPKDERLLASLAGFGRDQKSWKAVADDALHGFLECSDGRLYHPVIAEKAIEADSKRRVQRKRTEAATSARRHGKRDVDRDDIRNDHQATAPDLTLPDSKQDARVLDDFGLKKKAGVLAIIAAFCAGIGREPPDSSIVETWILDGIAPGTIAAVVPPLIKRKADMASLAYCDAAVREAHAKVGASRSIEQVPLTDADWSSAVKRYKSNRSQWSKHAGPEPGMIGCRAPPQVLVDFMIDPATGADITDTWHFISEQEVAPFAHDAQTRKVRPPMVYTVVIGGVEKTGFYSPVRVPAGYDEATGERIAPKSDEAAA
jgi:hypothetical protein